MKKLLLAGLLFVGLNVFADEFSITDFDKGMYSYPTANSIPDNSASYIQNFYTDTYNSLEQRLGFQKMSTTKVSSSSTVTGLWEFTDSDGDIWIISFSSQTFYKNTLGGTPTVFGQLQTVTTVPDCDSNLGKFWCTNGTDNVWWFDGSSTGAVTAAPKGRQIEAWRTRIVIADVATARTSVYFSEDGDGTSWTVGDLETDPFTKNLGGANDGKYITGLYGSYLDSLVAFRKNNIWFFQGFDQGDITVRQVSKEIGCIDGKTIQEHDGSLIFLSNRGIEKMTGWTIERISDPIRNYVDDLIINSEALRSNTQTSKEDFDLGTTSNTTTGISGYVYLTTSTSLNFTDSSTTSFDAGTYSSISSTQAGTSGGLNLYISTTNLYSATSVGTYRNVVDVPVFDPVLYARQEITSGVSGSILISSVTVYIKKSASFASSTQMQIYISTATGISYAVSSLTTTGASLSTTAGWHTFNFTSIRPAPNAVYYLYLSGVNYSGWDANADDPNVQWYRNSSGGDYAAKVWYTKYATSGNFISQSFDVGVSSSNTLFSWGTIRASSSVPVGTTLSWQTQTATATTGSWSTLATSTIGATIPSAVNRYIRYKASFTSDGGYSPTITSVTLNTSDFRSRIGTFVTQPITIGSNITSWGLTTINGNTDGGTLEYQFNASSWTTFNATSWTSIVSGQIPTNATNTYCAFRTTFTITAATQNPSVSDFTIEWDEGSQPQDRASLVYDGRYWLSFTTNTNTGAYNDTVLLYQRNKSWTLFKGVNAGSFTLWREYPYFGNSAANGYIYRFDVGNDDDGTSMDCILKTKSYSMGIPHKEKEFNRLYLDVTGDASYTGTVSMYYDVDRSGSEYSLGSLSLNEYTGQALTKFHFPASNVIQGRELQYILKKSGSSDVLKLEGFITDLTQKEPK